MTHIAISSRILGLLFILSAIGKWSDFRWFRKTVQAYELLPARLEMTTAVTLLVSETSIALMLLARVTPHVSGYLGALLLTLFSVAISINVIRGRTTINCGCGPAYAEDKISWFLVGRNASLILIAIVSSNWLAGQFSSAMIDGVR